MNRRTNEQDGIESQELEALRHRVLLYLYGEMQPDAARAFEQELTSNRTLADLLEEEQAFDAGLPQGLQPRIDEERLQGNRWVLRQKLARVTRSTQRQENAFALLLGQPRLLLMQGAAMACTFALGLFLAAGSGPDAGPAASLSTAAGSVETTPRGPLALIGDDEYEIYRLQVNSYDPVSGEIDLSFALASESRLTGNVSDVTVHQLMAAALQDDIDSAARMDTITALQPVGAGSGVHEALIHVLLNDENPGVRYQAVSALTALADRDTVREALRAALASDMNEGVRVQAFNALMSSLDEQTLTLFRDHLQDDANEYIRTQSRSIVDGSMASDDLILEL